MNCEGEVLGINTFGEGKIGGAIRIAALRTFLSSPELFAQSIDLEPPADQLRSVSSVRYPIAVLNHKIESEPLDLDAYKVKAGNFTVTAITPVLIAKIQVMQEKRRATNRQERRGNNVLEIADYSIEDTFYEWHRSTETALDYAITFDIRPDSGPTKSNTKWRIVPPMFRLGKARETEMEFKGEFLEFRIYRDGQLIEPIMPGRQVVEGNSNKKNQRFVDQAYSGNYLYSPEEFMTGNEFRMQIIDARQPGQVHKEVILPAESKLLKQLRADFTLDVQNP